MVTATNLTTTNNKIMTQSKAMYLLKTVWPQAPDTEVVKAAIICATYGLNPLLKQVSLIKFRGKNGDSWVTVLGIKASRNIALGTGHKWGYIDGPRVMTDEEQKNIFGQTYPDRIVAITRIKDKDGNEYPGYGFYPRNELVQGADKGNTPANMAFIRSERNALDKMAPGELPNADTVDEQFVPLNNISQALAEGKHEVIEEADVDVIDLWDREEAPVPVALINEGRASDIKALIDDNKLVMPVKDYMIKKYGNIIPLRRLTNEQADGLCKFIESLPNKN